MKKKLSTASTSLKYKMGMWIEEWPTQISASYQIPEEQK